MDVRAELPTSKELAGVNMCLSAGFYRELHWHSADEWAYMLYGSARVTVMQPDGTMYVDDVNEGDLWLSRWVTWCVQPPAVIRLCTKL